MSKVYVVRLHIVFSKAALQRGVPWNPWNPSLKLAGFGLHTPLTTIIVIFFVTKIIRETLDKANSITFYGFNLLHNSIIMNFDLETRD